MTAQAPGFLLPTWETEMEFLAPAPATDIVATWGVKGQMEQLSIYREQTPLHHYTITLFNRANPTDFFSKTEEL